ncbi:unnamed protein product [Jaminaea pallidilutea]
MDPDVGTSKREHTLHSYPDSPIFTPIATPRKGSSPSLSPRSDMVAPRYGADMSNIHTRAALHEHNPRWSIWTSSSTAIGSEGGDAYDVSARQSLHKHDCFEGSLTDLSDLKSRRSSLSSPSAADWSAYAASTSAASSANNSTDACVANDSSDDADEIVRIPHLSTDFGNDDPLDAALTSTALALDSATRLLRSTLSDRAQLAEYRLKENELDAKFAHRERELLQQLERNRSMADAMERVNAELDQMLLSVPFERPSASRPALLSRQSSHSWSTSSTTQAQVDGMQSRGIVHAHDEDSTPDRTAAKRLEKMLGANASGSGTPSSQTSISKPKSDAKSMLSSLAAVSSATPAETESSDVPPRTPSATSPPRATGSPSLSHSRSQSTSLHPRRTSQASRRSASVAVSPGSSLLSPTSSSLAAAPALIEDDEGERGACASSDSSSDQQQQQQFDSGAARRPSPPATTAEQQQEPDGKALSTLKMLKKQGDTTSSPATTVTAASSQRPTKGAATGSGWPFW